MDSRAMSLVGRTWSPSGATRRRPRALPAITRRPRGRLTTAPGTGSRLEQEVDRVAEEVVDLVAQLGVGTEIGIAVEDLLGDPARLHHRSFVARDAAELEIAESRLALAEHLA